MCDRNGKCAKAGLATINLLKNYLALDKVYFIQGQYVLSILCVKGILIVVKKGIMFWEAEGSPEKSQFKYFISFR